MPSTNKDIGVFHRYSPLLRYAVKYFVAKLVKSFGRLGDAAESLDDFRYTKACFQQSKMLHCGSLRFCLRNVLFATVARYIFGKRPNHDQINIYARTSRPWPTSMP